jgi:hypothetical protein
LGRILLADFVDVERVPFTFSSGTLVLGQVFSGQYLVRAVLIVDTAFDGSSPSITVGTTASPSGVFSAADSDPGVVGEYDTDEILTFPGTDFLQLVVAAPGATRGAGSLLYQLKR